MNGLVPFDRYEAVLLLDAYLKMQYPGMMKSTVVETLSTELRKMAVNRGMEIDDIFRNTNGISFQISSMESAYVGKTVHKPATRLFNEIVALYRNDRGEYERLLREAKSMITGDFLDKEGFAEWFSKNVPANLQGFCRHFC